MLGPAYLALNALEAILSSTDHDVALKRFFTKLIELFDAKDLYLYRDVPHFFRVDYIVLHSSYPEDISKELTLKKRELLSLANGPIVAGESILLPINSGWESILVELSIKRRATKEELVSMAYISSSVSQVLTIMEHTKMYQNEIEHRSKIERQNKLLQRQLVESAFNEGIAENAISVIHNMGNILTPIYSSISDMYEDKTEKKLYDSCLKCIQIMKEGHSVEGMEILVDVVDEMKNNGTQRMKKLELVLKQVQLMSETITLQQKYANMKRSETKDVDFKLLLSDIITLYDREIKASNSDVFFDLKLEQKVKMDINGLHYLISNAIINSCESILTAKRKNGKIQVGIFSQNEVLAIKIEDNGAGINNEIREKLFQFGATSKPNGHGFGLHNMANFVTSHKGSISLSNKDNDDGAILKITFPLRINEVIV